MLPYLTYCTSLPLALCIPQSSSAPSPCKDHGTEPNRTGHAPRLLSQPSPAALRAGAAATHEAHREWILHYPQLCTQRDSPAPQLQHTQSESTLAARRIHAGYRARPAVASWHGAHTYRSRGTECRSHERHVHAGSGAARRPNGGGMVVLVVVLVVL